MLLVDYRSGSAELLQPLQAMGLPAELSHDMPFGDVAFIGRGEKGRAVSVGIEFKLLGECVASMRTERLQGHQVPGMWDMYDYRWLLVEGELLFNAKGQLLKRAKWRTDLKPLSGGMSVGEFHKRLLVLHLCGGINPVLTPDRQHSLKWIEGLYRTFTDCDLDEHKSHIAIYQAPTPVPISDFRRAVSMWPHLGFKSSKAVEAHFGGSVARACLAPVGEWAEIQTMDDKGKTRRLGEKAGRDIVKFLEGK